ncbi:MAG: DUF1844 domain-containing protein [Ignavibacteria bacterium]|jgi:hypothetical protein|nr:DUF1844 domain-containing protein [Ignavibacteria bacterium]MCU7502050.1 DUF1844 domain-containing protein [Ignavibacteria bacterium]MCU7515452.1 DUF1844 domain-containing protein [Ignavibacteria bacterium]
METNELNEILFMQLVYQNQQLAMMGLGKLNNPVSGKMEKNLEQAKIAIDMLDMLIAKTKGNLGPNEEKFIHDVVRELKLNYVNESK